MKVTKSFPLESLIALAARKDPGIDLAVLEEFMDRAWGLPPADFELDDHNYQQLLAEVRSGQAQIRRLHEDEIRRDRPPPDRGRNRGLEL